jgi:hypothetical protein
MEEQTFLRLLKELLSNSKGSDREARVMKPFDLKPLADDL